MVMNSTNRSSKAVKKSVLKRFSAKTASEQRLLLKATLWSGVIRFTMRYLPFRVLKWMIEERPKSEGRSSPENENRLSVIQDTVKTVRSVSRHVPWESKCLVQASAAKLLLRKMGIAGKLCLGVENRGLVVIQEPGERKMKTHAWLVVGNQVVLGGENLEKYVKVSEF